QTLGGGWASGGGAGWGAWYVGGDREAGPVRPRRRSHDQVSEHPLDAHDRPAAPSPLPESVVTVLGADDVRRAVTRVAHEIIERNRGLEGVVLVGLQRGGVWLADMLADTIAR